MVGGGLVVHDADLARRRDATAMAEFRQQMQRNHSSGGGGGFLPALPRAPPRDPNAPWMRKVKAATVERAIQASEAHERHANGEQRALPYDRAADYYATLGIDAAASAQEVRRAFRRASLRVHPDKTRHLGPSERRAAADAFAALKAAHEVLSHEPTRREYDLRRAAAAAVEEEGWLKGTAAAEMGEAEVARAVECARRRLPPRRPPPVYVEVAVTLEELYAGCVKRLRVRGLEGGGGRAVEAVVVEDGEVAEAASAGAGGGGGDSSSQEWADAIVVALPIAAGAVAGTEYVLRRGRGRGPDGGGGDRTSSAGADLIVVLREAPHASVSRCGDDLV